MDSDHFVKKSKQLLSEFLAKADQWTQDFDSALQTAKSNPEESQMSSRWEQFEKQFSHWIDALKTLPAASPIADKAETHAAELAEELGKMKDHLWKNWQKISSMYGNSGRYFEAIQSIFKMMSRHQFLKLQASWLPEAERTVKEAELHQQNAEELRTLCRKQGGAWVKAAQFISCHAVDLPQVYSDTLAQLQDQADPIPWLQMIQVLEEAWGSHWQQRFRFIDQTPLATASIGQVHKAQMSYGPTVAIKIQIPGVSEVIKADLQFFETIASILNHQFRTLDLEQIVRELSKSILQELDYYHEASNLTQFFSRYQHQQWEYPILLKELLTTHTLGMYFIEGMPIRQFLEEVPSAAREVLKELAHSFLKQIFRSGLFHSDPHPGNFFVTPQGKIALLDFGSVTEITKEETTAYREVLTALLTEDFGDIEQLLCKAGFSIPHPEMLKTMLSRKKSEEYNELTKLQFYLEVMRQAQVKIPDNFVLMARVLIVIGGLLRQYRVRLDMSELALILLRD